MTMRVVKRDISLKELQNINKKIASGYLTYGVHRDKGVQKRGNTNEASIASFLEFGTGNIPPRPAIRTFLISTKARQHLKAKEVQAMAKSIRKKSADGFWESVGQFVQEYVKQRILSGLSPSNAESTIAKKGFDLPWVDTGQLVFDDMEARVHR